MSVRQVPRLESPAQILVFLNALGVGEIAILDERLEQARAACGEIGQPDLALLLDEALRGLRQGEMKTFRKRVQTVVARLGHLR